MKTDNRLTRLTCLSLDGFFFRCYSQDADTVAHEVYRPGSVVLDQIAQAFGSHLLIPIPDGESALAVPATTTTTTIHNHDDDTNNNSSGSSSLNNKCMMLDRKKLGSIVFADAQAMSVSKLELL